MAAPPTRPVIKLNGHGFTLPEGFTIELAAAPPVVLRPVAAAFDDAGRLYVTEASGTNDPVQKQLAEKPHRLFRLKDEDGDGRFELSNVFAEKLMLPQGVMTLGGSVYVGNPPVITKLTETAGSGKGDRRETWFDGKTLTGCANDLHGPYRGPDGWIYWTKGAFAKQDYTLPNGKPWSTRASHIFRARPDGTGIEPVMTGGMDNPVDVVFTPSGERIFTTTFFQHPGGGHRDGLIHAVYGGVYGKDHDPVNAHPWTGPDLMPVLTHLGAAAPCGLHRYESSALGADYKDNLFACCFNMHKVTRHVLIPDGATYRTKDEDFLVSDNIDFHPTDVIEDADGSLLVVDTGGWYKLCCPTSQFPKPDVFGAIYRVRKIGAEREADPLGNTIAWDKRGPAELVSLLGAARPVVRRRAVEALGAKGEAAIPELKNTVGKSPSVEARRNALWAAARIPGGAAIAQTALKDTDDSVRQVALHVISLHRDKSAVPGLFDILKTGSAHNKRAAAEALGRLGDKAAVSALLAAIAEPTDRVLRHSLIYALIETGDADGTAAGLKSLSLAVRRAAMIALDQMGRSPGVEAVAKELTAADPETRDVARWIVGRHPEWADALATHFRALLTLDNQKETGDASSDLTLQMARFARAKSIQTLLAERVKDGVLPVQARQAALRACGLAGLKEPPAEWYAAVATAARDENPDLVRTAIELARTLPAPKSPPEGYADALAGGVRNEKLPVEVRFQALALKPGGVGTLDAGVFDQLTAALHRDKPVPVRSAAADVLAKASLTDAQLLALTAHLKTTGPMELDRLLEPFARGTDEKAGLALLEALKNSPLRAGLRIDMLKPRLVKYNEVVHEAAGELYTVLNADVVAQAEKLNTLVAHINKYPGDVRRGQAVFRGTKATCLTCHAVGYIGGNVGPDLTKIGGVRTERDLLEAIVFPSASFVRSYEPVKVTTLDGKVFSGILKKDAPDELVLTISATETVRVARADVDAVTPGTVSVMPSGLDQQLSPQELADLVAFLKACK
ncbi:hypothetical protein FRUB_03481 [Fimbriiglobus ruber]|uniref:Cytochrome c domain-containing protein n=2 Tax=Fimbriiglobus ruber TaxID=1908690 RepID=A0A225DR59_9BACT|nr:hypothetical protein FRUB_03481 [Fimbriiglobus ruber]